MNPLAAIPLIAWWAISAGGDYVRGMAHARAGRWDEARAAFEAGVRKAPRDKRFQLELAGVAHRQGANSRAKSHLRRALALDPSDAYGNEFLGTLYFLEENYEGAIKYWNRARGPRIEGVRFEPEPRLKPSLADRALVFAPGEVLPLQEYRASARRLEFLGFFSEPRIALDSRGDAFEAVVRAPERTPGWIALLRGLPFETVFAEFPDIRGSGISVSSMLRWDSDKRRVLSTVATPLAGDPGWRLRLGFDARDENWTVPGAGDFKLRKAEGTLDLARMTEGGTELSAGFGVSSRSIPVPDAFGFASRDGAVLKARGSARRDLLRIPERRFSAAGTISGELGRVLEGRSGAFGKTEIGIEARLRAVTARLRAGAIGGPAPFDELFLLGIERDTDLWLRGHPATRGGRKGNGPIGRSFALANLEWIQPLWHPGFVTVSAGPFLDAGRAWGGTQSAWLADPGIQVVARVAGGAAVTLSWSRKTVYAAVSPLNW